MFTGLVEEKGILREKIQPEMDFSLQLRQIKL
jgi:hypothetical protein